MLKKIVSKVRAGYLQRKVATSIQLLDRGFKDPNFANQWQLTKFNRIWPEISNTVPFYKKLKKEKRIPDAFKSLEEIKELFPVIDRHNVQYDKTLLTSSVRGADWYRTTGGSTSQPIQMPAWQSEKSELACNFWIGRSWWGIKPDDRLFQIWGHSHLLGSGIKGHVNRYSRKMKNYLLGYKSFSAYCLDKESLYRAGDELLKHKASYIYGYSRALDLFCRVNYERFDEFRKLNIKAAIGCAESFPDPSSREIIKSFFNAPAIMEYGSVETFLMAHEYPDAGYRVFWPQYILETQNEGTQKQILVTSLYPRAFPLIRYKLGDSLQNADTSKSIGILQFDSICGRSHEVINITDSISIHPEAITHCLRETDIILGFQIIRESESMFLELVLKGSLSADISEKIYQKLEKIHPSLKKLQIRSVDKLRQTIAGKTPLLINIS